MARGLVVVVTASYSFTELHGQTPTQSRHWTAESHTDCWHQKNIDTILFLGIPSDTRLETKFEVMKYYQL